MKRVFRLISFISLLILSLENHAHLGWGLQFDSQGNLYFSDVINRRVLRITIDNRLEVFSTNKWVHDLQIDENDNLYLGNEETSMGNGWYSLVKISHDGSENYSISPTQNRDLFNGESFAVDSNGTIYNVHNNKIFMIDSTNHPIIFVGGERGTKDGVSESAQFSNIWTLQALQDGNLYAVDEEGNSVRKITLNGVVTTIAKGIINANPENTPFPGTRFNNAYGLDLDEHGNFYIAYNGNGKVFKISSTGNKCEIYSSEIGWFPTGVAFKDNDLFILENNQSDQLVGNISQRIVKLSADSNFTIIYENGKLTDINDYGITPSNDFFQLHSNYPNPFNPNTNISFNLYSETEIQLDIHAINGEHIVNLLNVSLKAGNYNIEWNGKDKNGKLVSSGVYYYRLRNGHYSQTKKMTLLR